VKKSELTAAVNARLTEQNTALAKLDDETALDVTVLFPLWQSGKAYAVDERIRYGEKLYRCVQAHTSQADWTPDATPALWTEVAKPGEIPVWKQPTGAQDAYNKGDMVHYPTANDPVYESTIDANVYAPDVYGWVLI
jgi:hypothetical protein